MLPPGEYVARASKEQTEWGESKNGKPECRIVFRIEEGEHKGESITAFQYASTPENTPITIKALRTCGCTMPDDDITNFEGIDSNQVRIVVIHDEHGGMMRAKVKYINSLDGVSFGKPMEAAKRVSFAQQMKGAVIMAKSKDGNTSTAASSPNDNSDIPF